MRKIAFLYFQSVPCLSDTDLDGYIYCGYFSKLKDTSIVVEKKKRKDGTVEPAANNNQPLIIKKDFINKLFFQG